MKKDYYEILEINKGATEKAIKKAYRKLAVKYHPDKNPDDKEAEENFKKINEAYDVLGDPKKREAYDRHGHDWERIDHMTGGANMDDIIRDMMNGQGRGRSRRHRAQGRDMKVLISLTLEEMYHGCEKNLKFSVEKTCDSCKGTGAKDGKSYHTCSTCGGAGERIAVRQVGNFHMQEAVRCDSCRGKGIVIDESCSDCTDGLNREIETAHITFPRGVQGGQHISVQHKGHYSKEMGAPRGHVHFVISEVDHEKFERHGMDISYTQRVSYEDLALGAEITIPTIHGKSTKIKVSPGSQNGKIFRMKGHGMPMLNLPDTFTPSSCPEGSFGNFIIKIEIDIPESYSDEEKELLKKLKELRVKDLEKEK